MWSEPIVTVAAASEPVSLAEARAHCRVTSSDHDTVLNLYIGAARDFAERYTGLRLVTQTLTISDPDFSEGALPVAPAQSIAIAYQDTDNAGQTLAASVYTLSGANTLRPKLSLTEGQNWPDVYDAPEAVTLTVVAGYATVPDAIKAALLLHIGHLFDNREAVGEGEMKQVPLTTMDLLENYRTFQ